MQPSQTRSRVFVVDPEPDTRALLCDVLNDAGYEALGFADGDSALAAASCRAPDVVLAELGEARGSGEVLAERLRGIGLDAIRVFAMSARDVDPAVAARFESVLVKPFDVNDLLSVVTRATAALSVWRRARS